MFYSKYRPQKFSDLIGLESLSKAIITALNSDKLAHAYFFYGPRGTGKTSVARLLAKALNCENLKGDVCGACSSCKAIEAGRFLDLIEIDAASNRGIDDIRALRDKVSLAPTHKKAKVYIIDEVHMLTTEAFNALLKTLEEPPKKVYFVLCTTDPQKVPDTIRSRCVKFEFRRVSEADIVRKLEKIFKEEKTENISLSKEDFKKIARAAVGGFRDAETLLEQVLIGGVTVDEVVSGGGGLAIDEFIDSLDKDISSSFSIIHTISISGVDLTTWGIELLRYLRTLLLLEAGISSLELDISEEKLELMKSQSKNFTISGLAVLIDIFSAAVTKIKDSAIPTLPLEVAVVSWFNTDFKENSGGVKNDIGPKGEKSKSSEIEETFEKIPKPEKGTISDTSSGILSDFQWDNLLKAVRPYNHSVEALLKSCKLVSFEGTSLHIEAFYSFHKERLETPKNRQTVESVLEELFGKPIRLRCTLGKRIPSNEELTDKNVAVPEGEKIKAAKTVLEVFDGGIEV